MEKTFEELIKERIDNFTPSEMVKLLQQVREATIEECEQYIRYNPEIALDFTRGRKIKIDIPKYRILTP